MVEARFLSLNKDVKRCENTIVIVLSIFISISLAESWSSILTFIDPKHWFAATLVIGAWALIFIVYIALTKISSWISLVFLLLAIFSITLLPFSRLLKMLDNP